MFAVLMSSSSLFSNYTQHYNIVIYLQAQKRQSPMSYKNNSIKFSENYKHKLAQQKTQLQTYYIILLNTFW